jgi:hypothetical protein
MLKSVKYEFVCPSDPTRAPIEIAVSEDRDMTEYISTMTRTGFIVKGPTVLNTVHGSFEFEPKADTGETNDWPATLACGHCGDILELVSIEDGYSCKNKDCLLHFSRLEQHA